MEQNNNKTRIIGYIKYIMLVIGCTVASILPSKLRIYNHIPNLQVGLIYVLPALQEYADFKGPCYLAMGHDQEYIIETKDQNPSGDIYFFEHTQFDPDPKTALYLCNKGEYQNVPPKFFGTLFMSPWEDLEYHYGKPRTTNNFYQSKKETGKIIEVPIPDKD